MATEQTYLRTADIHEVSDCLLPDTPLTVGVKAVDRDLNAPREAQLSFYDTVPPHPLLVRQITTSEGMSEVSGPRNASSVNACAACTGEGIPHSNPVPPATEPPVNGSFQRKGSTLRHGWRRLRRPFVSSSRRSKSGSQLTTLAEDARKQDTPSQNFALQLDRVRQMMECSPLGMFLIGPDGILYEANDRFFEMTGTPRNSEEAMIWARCVVDSSKANMDGGWYQLTTDLCSWSGELQLKTQSSVPLNFDGEPIDYWVMLTAQPDFAIDKSLRSISGSLSDISHLKWAEGLQNRKFEESEAIRRQQNDFIDITSHEMRNPLSAIMQCAEDITSALSAMKATDSQGFTETLEGCLEAANTITICVQHQKTIVDDILTVSKMASNLLAITPSVVQPVAVVDRALKMFDPELQAKDIKIEVQRHPSLAELGVDWAYLDPNRVVQILVNLMTNAIKFTADRNVRKITVSIAASAAPPKFINSSDFDYVPIKGARTMLPDAGEWGTGEDIFLQFKITDTGRGLTAAEKDVLFQRFSQASPRTHAQYGGSGLGLFISRQMAELHGGKIGVASEADVGSTFAFFIAARKAARSRRDSLANSLISPSYRNSTLNPQSGPSGSPQDSPPAEPSPDRKQIPVHILVVEDNLINQKVLVKQLKRVVNTVSTANDGTEALKFLEGTRYRSDSGVPLDIVLMDSEMPNMDGLTCVREIRKMEEDGRIKGHVPVIAVTANVRDELLEMALASGMDDVVSKPCRMKELYEKIESVLRKRSEATDGGKS